MTNIIVIYLFLIVGFVSLVAVLIKAATKREQAIYEDGLEVESEVVRVDTKLSDGTASHRRHYCYVQYMGKDGQYHEGLLNLCSDLPVGRKVRIRYLPGRYDEVVFVSQEIEGN